LNENFTLFVYGTLAPGQSNHHIMDGMTGDWRPGHTYGHIGKCEWGEYKGFPAFTPDKNGQKITGQIFTSKDLPKHWARLDEFEGIAYKRVIIEAFLEGGQKEFCNIYKVLPPN